MMSTGRPSPGRADPSGNFWIGTLEETSYAPVGRLYKVTPDLAVSVEAERIDLIYYSVIPWVSFTSFKHANSGDNRQTVPRMVFGKMFEDGSRRLMPFSVEVHHALMDGYHVGRYFKLFQEKLDSV